MARRERDLIHPYTGEPLSSGRETTPQKEKYQPIDIVVAATSSARRASLIRFLASGVPVIEMPLGEQEPETTKPGKVVADKLRRARRLVDKERGRIIPETGTLALLAADTISAPVALDRNGQVIVKHQSKPRRERDVDRVFRQMAMVAERSDEDEATYSISTASGVIVLPSEQPILLLPPPLEAEVTLPGDFLRWINRPENMERYKKRLMEFHESESYTNAGELKPITIMDIAAGFSIPVVTSMDGVKAMNGVGREESGFEEQFKKTVYIASAGVHPEVAHVLNPEANTAEWPFPQRMAEFALN